MPRRELLAILADRAIRWEDEDGHRLRSRRAELLTRCEVPVVGGTDWAKLDDLDSEHWLHETGILLRQFGQPVVFNEKTTITPVRPDRGRYDSDALRSIASGG